MAEKAESNGVDLNGDAFYCKACQLHFANIYEYKDHLENKQHIKMVMKKKYGVKYLAAKAKLDEKNSPGKTEILSPETLTVTKEKSQPVKEVTEVVEKPVKNSTTSKAKDSSVTDDDIVSDDEVYTCDVCEKVCTGLVSYNLHLKGKKHQKNVKKVTVFNEMKKQNMIPESSIKKPDEPKEDNAFDRLFPEIWHSPNLECKVCNKKCLGPAAYKQHCQSKSHEKKVDLAKVIEKQEINGLPPVKQDDNGNFAQCDVCKKAFSGSIPFMQHMKSPSHLRQEKHLEELGKIQDLIIRKDDSKIICKECGKVFSGPIPFNDHLKSSAHSKRKENSHIIENLEKNYPELIKTPAAENSDDSDEDDSIFLGCSVCNVVFSGPEAANDHFTSIKHKNTVKNKKMFQKYKQQKKAGKLLEKSGCAKTKNSDSDDSSNFEEEFDIINEK